MTSRLSLTHYLGILLAAFVILAPLFVRAQTASPQSNPAPSGITTSASSDVPMSKPGIPLNTAPAQNGMTVYLVSGLGVLILAGLGWFLTSRKNSPAEAGVPPEASGE